MRRLLTGRVLIATHNPGKLREMRELLAPYGITPVAAGDFGLSSPDETGASFAENAHIKARAAAEITQLPALADDSGLMVHALGGAPGVHSARWAGADKDFARAMRVIEEKLVAIGATSPDQRRASFVSVLALVWPDGNASSFEGRVGGTLVWPPRGNAGFGYDPMFLPDGHAQTFGEMTPDQKHGLPPGGQGLSHRARAFMALAESCLQRQ
jgi:XTP/dITP diphosphohydrolase